MEPRIPTKMAALWLDSQRWVWRRLSRRHSGAGTARAMPPHLRVGLRGEGEALFGLRRMGYTIVARRWTSPKMRGDLDLIGWEDGWLCFIEVKTRTVRDLAPAESAVDADKRRMIRQLARAYLRVFPQDERATIAVRFDIVSVYLLGDAVEMEVFRGAFGWHRKRSSDRN